MPDFTIIRGDDRSYALTVKDAAGVAVNLTGLTGDAIQFVARRRARSEEAVITKVEGDGIVITDGPAGEFRLDILPADTSVLGNWRQAYVFDVQVTVGGKVLTVARGTLIVEPEIAT